MSSHHSIARHKAKIMAVMTITGHLQQSEKRESTNVFRLPCIGNTESNSAASDVQLRRRADPKRKYCVCTRGY